MTDEGADVDPFEDGELIGDAETEAEIDAAPSTADPKFVCDGIFVTDVHLSVNSADDLTKLKQQQYSLEFVFGFRFPETNVLQSFLSVRCINQRDGKDAPNVSMRLHGYWRGEADELRRFAEYSASHMMPYLRTYLLTLTGWSPTAPIMLPIMNMTKVALEDRANKDHAASSESVKEYCWQF